MRGQRQTPFSGKLNLESRVIAIRHALMTTEKKNTMQVPSTKECMIIQGKAR